MTAERAGLRSDVAEKMKALERETRELRQANKILRKASAYFDVAELDCPSTKISFRPMSLQGSIRGKPIRTTFSDKEVPCPLDRVNRKLQSPAPNKL